MDKTNAGRPADNIAARDATDASEHGSEPRPQRIQSPSENEISAQDQQRLIGDGESYNSEYQKGKKSEPAVVCDPVFQLRG